MRWVKNRCLATPSASPSASFSVSAIKNRNILLNHFTPPKNRVPQVKFWVSFQKLVICDPNNSKWAPEKFYVYLHRKGAKSPDYFMRYKSRFPLKTQKFRENSHFCPPIDFLNFCFDGKKWLFSLTIHR